MLPRPPRKSTTASAEDWLLLGPDPWPTQSLTRAVRFALHCYHALLPSGHRLAFQLHWRRESRSTRVALYRSERSTACSRRCACKSKSETSASLTSTAAGQNKLIISQRMLAPESAPPLLVRDEATTRARAKQLLARDSNAAEGASSMESLGRRHRMNHCGTR
ncbi:hypothetical protein GGI42DRAFT_31584 [Trichoderma sp. SZMC 28013]